MAAIASSLNAKFYKLRSKLSEIYELRGYFSDFRELKGITSDFVNVLIDCEAKWDQLPNQHREMIRELKDAVYDADDHVDEFLTIVNQNQQLFQLRKLGKFFNKMSYEIKDILNKVAAVGAKCRQLELNVIHEPIGMPREETYSYVAANDVIIGRDKDKESVINMLLHGRISSGVRFLSIVGVGGLGKTALARVVFNDERIVEEFQDRLWVSVSDLDWKFRFNLELPFSEDFLIGKKYFLVLDDVWNEEQEKWLDLERLLLLGCEGSKVLVTTRSMRTATIVGKRDDDVYMLQGLSIEDSWRLFEMSAFDTCLEEQTRFELVEIGKNIVEECCCNPLAIKVVGNKLFGKPLSEWQSFQRSGLAKFGENDNGILPILKLSYHNLEPLTKSCFRYCAIFPNHVRIRKEKIIGLWMAQGYALLSNYFNMDQGIEHNAEEHFSNLLERCFFEDVVRDEYGDVESFKIHSLMHDIAREVGQEEIHTITSFLDSLGNNIRHVHHVGDECLDTSLYSNKIRSYVSGNGSFINTQIDNWMQLRVLDLSRCEVKKLPGSVGMLLHLCFLDLAHNKNLELLCDEITQLYNLQTLNLDKCDKLTCMPSGMNKLTNLRVLPLFVVGNSISSQDHSGEGMLEDIETLCNIRGNICIKIGANYRTVEKAAGNGEGYLKSLKHIKELRVEFKDCATCAYNPEDVLNELEPPSNIKGFVLQNFKGIRIGRWGAAHHDWTTSFSHLVHIKIWKCGNLQQMARLSKIPFLKTLSLFCLDSLEYMENAMSSNEEVAEFFPSLEALEIKWMERLKGWWNTNGVVDDCGLRLRFPSLLYLKIYKCPNLMSFSPCEILEHKKMHEFPGLRSLKISNCPNLAFNLFSPILETLELRDIDEKLQITCGISQDDGKRRHVEVDKVRHLKPVRTYSLTRLCIHGDLEVESLSAVKNVFQSCASSLRELEIRYCANLSKLSGLEHLTALEELKLLGNNQLSFSDDEEEPWKNFCQTLRHLMFDSLPKMKCLPKGMQYFTSLQILELKRCENLEALPQWMSCLSSLKYLNIIHCPRLRSLPEAMKAFTSLKNLAIQHGSDLK